MRYCSRCILPDTRPGPRARPRRRLLGLPRARRGARDGRLGRAPARASREIVERGAGARARLRLRHPGQRRQGLAPGRSPPASSPACTPLAVTWRTPGPHRARRARTCATSSSSASTTSTSRSTRRSSGAFTLRGVRALRARTAIPMHLAIFNVPADGGRPLRRAARRVGRELGDRVRGRRGGRRRSGSTPTGCARYGVVHGTTADDWVGDGLTRARPDALLRARPTTELREPGCGPSSSAVLRVGSRSGRCGVAARARLPSARRAPAHRALRATPTSTTTSSRSTTG